jgi:hypothetical protein
MKMLKPASNKQAFAKVGIYGNAGSGKTYTAALIAIGLHKYAKATKPIGMFDTEPAASYIIPLFEKAGIPFLVYDESRALRDLMAFMDVIVDSVTHVWRDTQESYLAKLNEGLAKKGKRPIHKLEFHHWGPIKAAWAKFTDRYLSSKLHVIVCGRAGSIYEYQENAETGKKELITTGTRMATEKEMGYEPSLLIEMVPAREDGQTINRATVIKDRTATLNGQEIDFPDFEKVKSHFAFLNLGGEHYASMDQRDSKEMFTEDGQDDWSHEQRQRGIWSEEISGLMQTHYPAQTAEHKAARLGLMQEFFGTKSWKKIEEATPSKDLKAGFERMKAKLEPTPAAEIDIDEVVCQIKDAEDDELAALALDTAAGHPREIEARNAFNARLEKKAA